MQISLKEDVKEFEDSLSIWDIISDMNPGLARVACAAEVDGRVMDLRTILNKDCAIHVITSYDDIGKQVLRHTISHIMAQAVRRLRPGTKLAIGPAIENGFYYDFDTEPFSAEDLEAIESEMKKIMKENPPIERFELPRDKAIALMQEKDQPYKVQLIEELPEGETISFYMQGDFLDLCAGPHLMNMKNLKYFKLLSSSGAYWKGSEKNKMLARIYGTAFTKKQELTEHLDHLEDIKKRDHNKLGREMELFTTVDVIGQGLPLLMPKGAKIVQQLQRWIEDEEEKRGYVLTKTPFMAKSDLYKISGHWQHYRDSMFVLGDGENEDDAYALRPMTCPFQYYIYKASQKSYRDLPIRYAETSTLFRNEESGEMHGLIRVRQFTISEGHLIVRPDQVESEIKDVIDLNRYCMKTLGILDDVTYRFSKWDENNQDKYIGDKAAWEKSQNMMRKILQDLDIEFEEADGEAAFYGPKLDIQFKNVYGKEDTIITVQLDLALAEQYDMTYIDSDGTKKHPYIIHRTAMGCYERTLAMLIEKFAGLLPTWLCPEQVRVLPISEKHHEYAAKVKEQLQLNDIRCTVDERAEKIGYKIREARLDKIPYLLIVGQQEEENNMVAIRSRYDGDVGQQQLAAFINHIAKEIRTKEIRKIHAS